MVHLWYSNWSCYTYYEVVFYHDALIMKRYFTMVYVSWSGILSFYIYHEVEIGHVTLTIKFYSLIDNVTCHLPGSGNLSCCA